MAKIVKTTHQETALRDIVAYLKFITKIDGALAASDGAKDATLTVLVGGEKASLPVAAEAAVKILADARKNYAGQVKSLSRKYAIELDADDLAVLAGARGMAAEAEAEVKAKAEAEEADPADEPEGQAEPDEADEAEGELENAGSVMNDALADVNWPEEN